MSKINKKFKPEDVIKKIESDDVVINVMNHNSIASVFKSDKGKYIINITRDLNHDLVRYFIFHEIAHILNNHVEDGVEKYFNFEFEEVDILALETYKHFNFDVSSLEKSSLFQRKLMNADFLKLIKQGK